MVTIALGCAAADSRVLAPAAAVEGPAQGVALVTESDRERLARLTDERSRDDPRDGYRIGPDDLLEIRIPDLVAASAPGVTEAASGIVRAAVAEAPTYHHGLRVSSQGDVAIPYLGLVRVEGLTPRQAEDELARRLQAAHLLVRPQVAVSIVEYRSGVVAVMGSVLKPGLYPITRPGATLADLVWAAGGPSEEAGRVVSFSPDGSPDPIRLDLEVLVQPNARAAQGQNPRVRPGDVVSIAPAGNVLVDGWVEKPGSYAVTRGLTLAGAVAAAGGKHFAADPTEVTVKRSFSAEEHRVFTVDLTAVTEGRAPDFPLTDGDVVRLPASTARVVPWALYNIGTQVISIGGNVLLF